jgi:hypothetical protein
MPEIKPMAADIIVPINIFIGDKINWKSPENCEAISEAKKTNTSPIKTRTAAK